MFYLTKYVQIWNTMNSITAWYCIDFTKAFDLPKIIILALQPHLFLWLIVSIAGYTLASYIVVLLNT